MRDWIEGFLFVYLLFIAIFAAIAGTVALLEPIL